MIVQESWPASTGSRDVKSVIHPIRDRQRELEMTNRLVAAISEELWQRYGANGQLGWLKAESHLQRLVGQARAEASEAQRAAVALHIAAATGTTMRAWLGQANQEAGSVPGRATRVRRSRLNEASEIEALARCGVPGQKERRAAAQVRR